MLNQLEYHWLSLNTGMAPIVATIGPVMMAFVLAAGIVACFAGRRFAWVFTGIMGLLLGLSIGPQLVGPMPLLSNVFVLSIAVIGAFLGVAAHRPAAVIIGLLAFSGVAVQVLRHYSLGFWVEWAIIVAAGIAGLLVAWRWREWTLIGISALYGAFMTVLGLGATFLETTERTQALLFVLLFAAGLIFQVVDYLRTRHNVTQIPASAGGVTPAPPIDLLPH